MLAKVFLISSVDNYTMVKASLHCINNCFNYPCQN